MKKLLIVLICLGLVGCATAYKKEGFTGGYADMKIQDDIFKVSFRGNAYCGRSRAENFALLRCAEVALNNGYKYFVIIEGGSDVQTSSYTTPVTAQTYGTTYGTGQASGYSYGGTSSSSGTYSGTYSGTTYYTGGQTYTYHKPSVNYTIKCLKEKPENIPAMVYDARQIEKNIEEQYGIR